MPANLIDYARKHRLRVRNLQDGGPVPPAIWKAPKGWPRAVRADECWAIVGYDGYIADEGRKDRLGMKLFYGSGRGVNIARKRMQHHGWTITQEGDTEIACTFPIQDIEKALQLIRVSRLRPGSPGGRPENFQTVRAQKPYAG